ncbi:phosphate-starvation-inducible PsiE family protein [Sphaerisporangium sp. NPDC088356]|uniref:phosphate-starvation-inducible PsiE family protein n=1 Tax=Sphaerisporangium sp. NPDC088356 TaxID=3154871 RepID=UPI003433D040
MPGEPDGHGVPGPQPPLPRPDSRLIRLLGDAEHAILYLVSVILLAVALGILVQLAVTIVRSHASWPQVIIVAIEELLLVLIVLELFVTVLTHLQGGHLLLEPFIIVGIIAVVRHILSVVVRLTVAQTPDESGRELMELGVYAGATFLLVAALTLSRWSRRWPGENPPHSP